MALPFVKAESKTLDRIIAIDLGARSTKAVHVQYKNGDYTLLHYVVMDAPIYEKTLSTDLLTEHLKAVHRALETKTRAVSLVAGVNDSLVKLAEVPQVPFEDMRQILKTSSKTYLQQDLPGHAFDCFLIAPGNRHANAPAEGAKAILSQQKNRVLVGGARAQLVEDFRKSTLDAGLSPQRVIPGIICPLNAFEQAMKEMFRAEPAALVDIGFKSSSICLINNGELVVSRVLGLGGDKLTQGLADAMNISYAEAEGIKLGMPAEVQSHLEPLLSQLARELRASIDFFEHQQDKAVSRVYFSGGTAQSLDLIKGLEAELLTACLSWNPTIGLELAIPAAQHDQLAGVAPRLAVAVGAAIAAF